MLPRSTSYNLDTVQLEILKQKLSDAPQDNRISKDNFGDVRNSPCVTGRGSSPSGLCCEMCFEEDENNYIILDCNHIFHINCLAALHHGNAKAASTLDENFFQSQNCPRCKTGLDNTEILFIHRKFFKNTKRFIDLHNENIKDIEEKVSKLKQELNVSLKYKQKLEYEREKSTQIVQMLST